MEYRDLYDENRQLTDKKILKDEEVPKGYFYTTVVIMIQDSRHLFLLQINKKFNKWSITGGHPKSGESSLQGAITELKEELGYDCKEESLQLIKTYKTDDDFVDLYYLADDVSIDYSKMQVDEVAGIRYYTKEEIDILIDKKMFLESHIEFYKDTIKYLEEK